MFSSISDATFLLPLSLIVLTANALPTLNSRAVSNCTAPIQRQEWSSASLETRQEYVSAVQCLATKPSRLGLSTSLYDDFAWVHQRLNAQIHFVAAFLPWHRLYLHTYELALKEQCNYSGSLMYWDWTKDSAAPWEAAIWDATTGIGGNGNRSLPDGQRCLVDGPFKDLRPAYFGGGPLSHCLRRSFNNGTSAIGNMFSPNYTPEVVRNISDEDTFTRFTQRLERGPHGAVHSAVGGDMAPATSPNDPLFFIHHAQVDRLWWLWQNAGVNRTNLYAGNLTQTSLFSPVSQPARLTDIMPFLGLSENLAVIEVMSTETNLLCYTY